jgi:hypothetical protein
MLSFLLDLAAIEEAGRAGLRRLVLIQKELFSDGRIRHHAGLL